MDGRFARHRQLVNVQLAQPRGGWAPWSLSAATFTVPIGPVDLLAIK
jgi:hypothetical protein